MALTQVSSDGIKNLNVKTADLENSGVTAGTYGSASLIPALVIDAKGRVTSASTNAISTDLVNDTSPQLGGNLDVNTKNIVFGDSSDGSSDDVLSFGAGTDLKIYHEGTNSIINNQTGDLYIQCTGGTSDDIIIEATDNIFLKVSGNEAGVYINGDAGVELYHDQDKTAWTHGSGFNIKGGNTSDLTELIITGNEGQAASILMSADDGDDNADHWRMYSNADNSFTLASYAGGSYQSILKGTSSRSIELNYQGSKKFETTSYGVLMNGHTNYQDNQQIRFGASNDLQIYHDGTSSFIDTATGHDLYIRSTQGNRIRLEPRSGENGIQVIADGAVELYYDNSKKFETYANGCTVTGNLNASNVDLGDNAQARFGTDNDAFIKHSGSDLFIENDTGGFNIKCTSGTGAGEGVITFSSGTGTERMRIDSSGNKIMDSTFDVNSTSSRRSYFTSTGQQVHSRNAHESYIVFTKLDQTTVGSITRGTTTTAYNTTSDYRLKENVTGISDGITRLKTLKPSRFNFKADAKTTVDGFLAHEVSSIVPEAIEGEKDALITQAMLDSGALQGKVGDPLYQQIDQSKLVPLLTAALQEAIAKIETLETKVAALEAA